MYKAIKFFTDLHDDNYPYNVGDTFPRDGVSVSTGRLDELAGSNNKQGVPLIEYIDESKKPEALGEPEKPTAKRGRKPATEKE